MIKVRHIGITVNDFEKMLDFYSRVLGFSNQKIALETGEYIDNFSKMKGVSVTTAKLSNGTDEVLVELLKYHSHQGEDRESSLTNPGISHFALTVENLAEFYQKATSEGIDFNAPPQSSPDGKALVTFCREIKDSAGTDIGF